MGTYNRIKPCLLITPFFLFAAFFFNWRHNSSRLAAGQNGYNNSISGTKPSKKAPKKIWHRSLIAFDGIFTVTPSGRVIGSPNDGEYIGYFPSFSPDRAQIAYCTDRKCTPPQKEGIWVMRADFAYKRRLTTGSDEEPCWSPDGRKIAFSRALNPGAVEPDQERSVICILDIPTRKITRLTDGNYLDTDPAWSSDGRTIAFTSNRSKQSKIWLMDVSGGNLRLLPNQPRGICRGPDWSPKGNRLLFCVSNGHDKLCMMDSNGKNRRSLQVEFLADYHVAWSPDGNKIVYVKGVARRAVALFTINVDGSGEHQIYPKQGGGKWGYGPDW